MDAPSALSAAGLLRSDAESIAAPPRVEPASVPLDHFHWLPPCPRLFEPDPLGSYKTYDWSGLDGQASLPLDRHLGDRLAAVRAVRPTIDALRVGWLFVAGPGTDGRRIFHPLVTVPVKVSRGGILGPAHLAPAGDAMLTRSLPTDARRTLTEQLHLGGPRVAEWSHPGLPTSLLEQLSGLHKFATAAAAALGFPATRLVPADRAAEEFRAGAERVIVAGFGAFAISGEDPDPTPSAALARWLAAAERRDTALHSLLGGMVPGVPTDGLGVESPLALSGTQRRIVDRVRSAPLTVVSGVTGTGKTSTAAAIAMDSATRGERVLVLARSAGATDALIEVLLAHSPAPPVAFGSTDRRPAVLARLVAARSAVAIADLAEAAVARDRARGELLRRRESVARELRAERAWLRRRDGLAAPERTIGPRLFTPSADLERAGQLAEALSRRAVGPLGRWRRAHARRQLIRSAGAGRRTSPTELTTVVAAAVADAGADVLEAIGGADLESAWARLAAVDGLARDELTRWLATEARHHDAPGRSRLTILRTIGEVHRALRNGRALRRLQLAQVSTGRLTTVLPIWVGSLADVDEILPARLGLFDLVVIEEATTVPPALAAPALLRGRRAVLLGDPVGDAPGGEPSVHELAGERAPGVRLEHQFVAPPELVGGALARVAPNVHAVRPPGRATRVEAVRVEGQAAATAAVLARVQTSRRNRSGRVAVVATARHRAAELERQLLATMTSDEVDRLGLTVGSLDDLPAIRADVMVAELVGTLPDGSDAAVLALGLVGRAGEHVAIVHDGGPWATAVLTVLETNPGSDPAAGVGRPAPDPWTASVAAVLDEAGFAPLVGWPSGRHVIDVATIRPAGPTAVVTTIDADGVEAHIDRHLELSGAGWRVIEVFPSRWAERLEKLPDHVDNRWRG